MRRFSTFGVPIFNDRELKKLDRYILARPCPTCGARRGKRCASMNTPGNFHMGRLPDDFDSAKVVWGTKP